MTEQLPKLGSLTKRSEFLHVRNGHYSAKGGVVIQMRAPASDGLDPDTIRVGFTATKRIGNAVTRNRAKRRLREVARAILPKYGHVGQDYVFIARDGTTARDWDALLDDARKALITLSQRVETPATGPTDSAEIVIP